MEDTTISIAKRRLVDRLKRGGPCIAKALAAELDLTEVAIRQHLGALEELGLVEQRTLPPSGRGRPATEWSLTELASGLFPERHAELTVGLIDAIRRAHGDDGLQRVIDIRADEQLAGYQSSLPPRASPLGVRVKALAERRTAEGYLAEVIEERDGSFTLIEHHCPICDAARCCVGLCAAELDVFRQVLGPDVGVQRNEHLLDGDRRCTYRIRPLPAS